jgi:hypothetical protein
MRLDFFEMYTQFGQTPSKGFANFVLIPWAVFFYTHRSWQFCFPTPRTNTRHFCDRHTWHLLMTSFTWVDRTEGVAGVRIVTICWIYYSSSNGWTSMTSCWPRQLPSLPRSPRMACHTHLLYKPNNVWQPKKRATSAATELAKPAVHSRHLSAITNRKDCDVPASKLATPASYIFARWLPVFRSYSLQTYSTVYHRISSATNLLRNLLVLNSHAADFLTHHRSLAGASSSHATSWKQLTVASKHFKRTQRIAIYT